MNKLIHAGVILLRLSNDSSENKIKALNNLFKIHLEELGKAFTVVTENKVRIRKD